MASPVEGPDPQKVPEELEADLSEFLTKNDSQDKRVDRQRYEAVAGCIQELLAEQEGGHNEIDTRSGEKIRPLDPDPALIHLEDIAHGLSNVGRFAGQGQEFLSVARHSVHVSYEVEARDGSPEAQRYALVHDAAEAYLSDVPGPVKKSIPGYKHVERRFDETVVDALGLGPVGTGAELVEEADEVVGEYELSVQFPDRDHEKPARLRHDPEAIGTNKVDKTLYLDRALGLGLV